MGTYIVKRILLMIPTFILISLLVFVIVSLAPGRAGETQLTGGEGESVREAAGAREGYLLFKLQYGLNRPMLFNTRYNLSYEDVEAAVRTITDNLTATVSGETEAISVGRTTADVIENIGQQQRFALNLLNQTRQTKRAFSVPTSLCSCGWANPGCAVLTVGRLAAQSVVIELEQLEINRLASISDPVIRPPRPPPENIVEAQDNLEDWGMYAVPHLMTIAVSHDDAKTRWQAVEYLTLNAQDRAVNPETGVIVARHPEQQIERMATAMMSQALWVTTHSPGLMLHQRYLLSEVSSAASVELYDTVLPRTNVATWSYALNAPQTEIDDITTRWATWYERNSYRFDYDFWDRVGIFFTDNRLIAYWGNLLRGSLGVSTQMGRPVTEVIFERWQYSIYLSLLSLFFAYFLSVPIGLYSAVKQGQFFDRGMSLVLFLLYSLPSFFVATLLGDYLTGSQNTDNARKFIRFGVLFLCCVPGPILTLRYVVRKAKERGRGSFLARGHALGSAGVVFCVGLGLAKLLLFFGPNLAVLFFLLAAWPLYKTVRDFTRRRKRYRERAEHLGFPYHKVLGVSIAAILGAFFLQALAGFFPGPVSGFSTEGAALNMTTWEYFKDIATHLVLPVFCLTYAYLAYLSRYARSGLLDVIRSDYIRTARAKGLSEPVVIMKHAVRNGMIPILTLLGTALPALIGGSVVIEVIFSIPGMGQLILSSVLQKDFTVIMGVLQISAVLTLIGLLLTDISYAIVDPRISFK